MSKYQRWRTPVPQNQLESKAAEIFFFNTVPVAVIWEVGAEYAVRFFGRPQDLDGTIKVSSRFAAIHEIKKVLEIE